jgi:(S)-2-hydroxyglutarate dehydrogenase
MPVAEPPLTDQPPRECDLVVVGGGIIGLAVARELSLRHGDASICLLEAERRLGAHQTGHSSGVVHAGIYYRPGSLRARLCVAGARELLAYCEERGLGFERSGKVIVAVDEEELPRLDELERRGRANGVEGLRRLDPGELREVEPHAAGIAALHSPATGIVDFAEVARAYAGDAAAAGASIVAGCRVRGLRPDGGGVEISHSRGATRARLALVCAGPWADRLAVAAGAPEDPRIVPFRGAYLRLRAHRRELVRANIYSVPDPELPFLGAHLTRGLDGEVLLGPSALLVGARDAYRVTRVVPRDLVETVRWAGTWRLVRRHWRYGLAELARAASKRAFVASLRRYVPALSPGDVLRGPVGVRAQALGRDGRLIDDFVISRTERAVHVRNAPSPAATSSLALARVIADEADAELV